MAGLIGQADRHDRDIARMPIFLLQSGDTIGLAVEADHRSCPLPQHLLGSIPVIRADIECQSALLEKAK